MCIINDIHNVKMMIVQLVLLWILIVNNGIEAIIFVMFHNVPKCFLSCQFLIANE